MTEMRSGHLLMRGDHLMLYKIEDCDLFALRVSLAGGGPAVCGSRMQIL